ncbi:MAG TPA: tetratricopeptide repeat protein [Desulfuromonadales bacterium]|nr:tetratricopeptide repeat protein [Desulfuromonadales bacterium]
MQQDNSSFWTDIKTLEERLTGSPDSLCFAQLSEKYLAVGLTEDALYTARQGVQLHPAYLGGQRALALACHAKGLDDECLAALRQVTEALPEDLPTQKLLAKLLIEVGNYEAADRVYKIASEFAPDDPELLNLMKISAPSAEIQIPPVSSSESDDEEILEELEIYEELEIIEDDDEIERLPDDTPFQQDFSGGAEIPASEQDPLVTPTMAELYVSQGFVEKAQDIYRTILAGDPGNQAAAARLADLETPVAQVTAPEIAVDDFSAPPAAEVPDNLSLQIDTAPEIPATHAESAGNSGGKTHDVLAIFEGWLTTIGRIKACR